MNKVDITPETRIIDLTVGQLIEIITKSNQVSTTPVPTEQEDGRRLVYGISGIAQIFNCSLTTANRIKSSGRIDDAIVQNGRTIVIDADLALELYNNK